MRNDDGPGIDFCEACEALNWFNTHVVQPTFNKQLRWHGVENGCGADLYNIIFMKDRMHTMERLLRK